MLSVGPARVIASNRAEWHRCQRGCISIAVGVSDGSYLLTSSSKSCSSIARSRHAVGTRRPVWSAAGFFYGLLTSAKGGGLVAPWSSLQILVLQFPRQPVSDRCVVLWNHVG